MTERINQLLNQLYPADDAAALSQWIDERAAKAQAETPTETGELFTERDVVLITYGDSLRKDGEKPLVTLRRFAQMHFSNAISSIHILPFFPYSSDDGFSILDFYQVNPTLGTWSDIEAISEDFRLMVDAVFNHMSAQSDWFKRFLAAEPGYENLFMTESPDTDLSDVTRPRASQLLTPFKRPDGSTVHVWTTFSADQVDFDARSANTVRRLLDILLFYVEKGVSIIRLDAIAYLWKIAGTSSIHLKQTHQVIQLMRAVLDKVAPHVILITETNVPHDENVSYFGDGTNEAQLVYNFTLPPLTFHTLLTGDATKLSRWINTLTTPSERTTFFNFTASHDGIGVRPVEGILAPDELDQLIQHVTAQGGRVSYKQNSDGTTSPYELNISYFDAVTNPALSQDLQVRAFLISQGIALVLAGMPAIYIHSLLGSRSDIEGMLASSHNRSINRARLNSDTVSQQLADANSLRAQVFKSYQHMIEIRRQHYAFHPNSAQHALSLDSPALLGIQRTAPDSSETIYALFNVSDQPQTVTINKRIPTPVVDILSERRFDDALRLQPYEMVWLKPPS